MHQEPNLGGQERGSDAAAGTMSAQDERTWSVLAHLSMLLVFVSLIPFGALLIWLIYKDRSEKVRFHALQALWYQVAWIVIFIAYTLVTVVLSVLTFGLAVIPLVLLWLLCGLPGQPGGRVPLPVHSGQDRGSAQGDLRAAAPPRVEGSMPWRHTTFAEKAGTRGRSSRPWLRGGIGAR